MIIELICFCLVVIFVVIITLFRVLYFRKESPMKKKVKDRKKRKVTKHWWG